MEQILVEAVNKTSANFMQQVQDQLRIREKIESNLQTQNIQKRHSQIHAEEAQAQIRAETNAYKYDKFVEVQERVEQGKIVDIKV